MSEADRNRRQNMAKSRYEKLKNLENFIEPTKLLIHNIPKKFDENQIRLLCRKAANGNLKNDVAKRARPIKKIHLMLDKSKEDENDRSLGYAFVNFVREEDALKCLRILNNHPDVFFKDKRPIVEFAVENSKALKILSDRVERNRKKLELRRQIDNTGDQLQAEPDKKKKRLRPWQIAKEERKKKRRLAQRQGENEETEKRENSDRIENITESVPAEISPVKKSKKSLKKSSDSSETTYGGLKVQKGTVGQLKAPKHVGTKIRARDRGKITRERQEERKKKRKQNLKKLSVAVPKKVKGSKPNEKKEAEEGFDKLVNKYKSKISAGLKLL